MSGVWEDGTQGSQEVVVMAEEGRLSTAGNRMHQVNTSKKVYLYIEKNRLKNDSPNQTIPSSQCS